MEFTLGFCGGLGMAYAVLSTEWPKQRANSHSGNWLALFFVFLIIPFINFTAAFETGKLSRLVNEYSIADADSFQLRQKLIAVVTILVFSFAAAMIWQNFRKKEKWAARSTAIFLFFSIASFYTLFSYYIKGVFLRPFSFKHSETAYLLSLIHI